MRYHAQKNYNWLYSDINPSYNLIVTLSLSLIS